METTEHKALPETLLPEPGELFVEETPKPFALSLREILEEYRSDSSPARYAMAVELGEADDWELIEPPQAQSGSYYPLSSADMQSLLHDSWAGVPSDRASASPDDWRLSDILNEFGSGSAAASARAEERELPSMTMLTEQSDRPVSPADTPEDALPAGIHALTERRSAPLPESSHLSVEDILAEFRAGAPAPVAEPASAAEPEPIVEPEPAAEPVPAAESEPAGEPEPAAEPEPVSEPETLGRRTGLEAEARNLFAAFRRGKRLSAAEEAPLPAEDAQSAPQAEDGVPVKMEEFPAEAEDIPVEPEDTPAKAEKKPLFTALRGRRRREAVPESAEAEPDAELHALRDTDAAPAAYAPDEDYGEDGDGQTPQDSFPSFGEYLLGLAAGVWVRLRGLSGTPAAAVSAVGTMESETEDLGEEVKPAPASRYYGSFIGSLRLRSRLALVLWLVMAYITLGVPASGMLRTVKVASALLLGLQFGIMLLALDVVVGAGVNLARRRFGADALAVLSCLLTAVDAAGVATASFGKPHVPLCLFSSFSLLGLLLASLLSARGLRKALRVPAIGKNARCVTAEAGLKDNTVTLVKSQRPVTGFVRRSEEAAPDETAYNRAAPALLLLSFVLSLVLVLAKGGGSSFLFLFTAMLAPAVPVSALLCFALPFMVGSERIFPSGAAIAGWSGLCDIGGSHNLIVTDRDLFPDNTVEIETTRIFADESSEKIISYAGSMITASGCGLGPCFASLMEHNACTMRQIERFEILPGGGMRGEIEGHTVLCGGIELMRLMNVDVPYRLIAKTSVLLAVDGMLFGIFNMKYTADERVRRALIGLMRSNRHAIFAIRDFNVTPAMLHETFGLATDGYDFPPYLERFSISEAQPGEERKIAAVLCREGLGPLVHMADTGRSMYLTVRLNLLITLLASLLGVAAVFAQFLLAGSISVSALFLYSLACLLLVGIVSLYVRF